MPNTQSAKKQARQNLTHRIRNQSRKSEIKTIVKKLDAAVQTSDVVRATALLREAESKIARARSKGVFHWKTAARKISRLSKRVAMSAKEVAAQ